MRAQARIVAVLVVLSIAFQACFITLDAFFSDEGVVLVAAADVAEGRRLYRDSYVPVTPAVYLLQGAAFKLFGSRLLVSRALMCAVYAASVALVFVIAARFLPLRRAALAGALAIPLQLWMWPHAHFFSYNALAIAFCVLAIALAGAVETRPRRLRAVLGLGAALGAGLWTKPNLAAATGAGVLLYWISVWLRSAAGLECPRRRGLAELVREGLVVLAGVAAVSAPLLAYLLATDTLGGMVESLLALGRIYGDVPGGLFPAPFPPTGQLDALRLTPGLVLPGLITTTLWDEPALHYLLDHTGWIDLLVRVVYYAPVALLLALAAIFAARLGRRLWTRQDELALLTFCAGGLLYLTIVPHPAVHYMIPTLLPLLPLGVYLWGWLEQAARPLPRRTLRFAGALAVLLYAGSSLALLGLYLSEPRAPVSSPAGTLWVPRPTARLWNEILDYARAEVPDEDPVFVYPYFPIFYFLTGLDHATRFVDLRPGSPGRGAEDEIIEELERQRVKVVFYFSGAQYPGIERWNEAYPRLQHYLETHFERVREFRGLLGSYAEVRRRRVPKRTERDEAQVRSES